MTAPAGRITPAPIQTALGIIQLLLDVPTAQDNANADGVVLVFVRKNGMRVVVE